MSKVNNENRITNEHGKHVVTARDLSLDESSFKQSSAASFAVSVRVLQQNWRQGTVACKGRSDVNRTNKKPWKQKGTGRARAGSARSPIWRGGGVTFGPQPRTRTLSVSKKVRRNVMASIFFNALQNEKVIALDWVHNLDKPKTAVAFNVLKNAALHKKSIILFLPLHDELLRSSFANIPSVRILGFDQPNVYELAQGEQWVIFKQNMNDFKEMVSRWI